MLHVVSVSGGKDSAATLLMALEKPAIEPICMARKPMEGTLPENLRKWGTGALNINGCMLAAQDGVPLFSSRAESRSVALGDGLNGSNRTGDVGSARWPANVIHDGSDEVIAAFQQATGQMARASTSDNRRAGQNSYGAMTRGSNGAEPRGGSAARFFYCAKADRADRNAGLDDPGPQFGHDRTSRDAQHVEAAKRGNHHPTVKPTDLMRHLCRLVTPPGGTVLDPFMGSGSTLKAAELEGFGAIGIERDQAYIEIARRRIACDAPLFAEVTIDA